MADLQYYTPEPIWQGETAYVIGGGRSLLGFDFERLRGRHCIGCNDAYMLGDLLEVAHWGDQSWFALHWTDAVRMPDLSWKAGLKCFEGLKITSTHTCYGVADDVKVMRRVSEGLHYAPKLGWNGNTGSSAINLALVLGAKRVVLLGFDMQAHGKFANWYINLKLHGSDKLKNSDYYPSSYRRFASHHTAMCRDWHSKFADRQIVNAGPIHSPLLDGFPCVDLDKELL